MRRIIGRTILVILLISIISVIYQKFILKVNVSKVFGVRNFSCKNWEYGARDRKWRIYNN